MNLIFYILFFIALISLIFYFFFKSSKKSILKNKDRYNNQQFNIKKSYLDGYYDIQSFIDNKPLLPYMFTHLSKDFISNDNCKWNINYLSHLNKHKLFLNNNPICMYINNEKICLYKLNNSIQDNKIDDKIDDCDKPTLCSTDSILDKIPNFNEDNSLFIINKLSENKISIQKDGKYICKINDEIQLSDNFNDNCIWLISP
jgi:hypothetical protein